MPPGMFARSPIEGLNFIDRWQVPAGAAGRLPGVQFAMITGNVASERM